MATQNSGSVDKSKNQSYSSDNAPSQDEMDPIGLMVNAPNAPEVKEDTKERPTEVIGKPSNAVSQRPNESKVKGSESWKKQVMNEDSWNPVNLLQAVLKDDSFDLRWVRDGNYSKVQKSSSEGWVPVAYNELKDFNELSLQDGQGLDTVVRMREMILMKMPKRRIAAKQKFIESKIVDPNTSKKEFRQNASVAGAEVLEEEAVLKLKPFPGDMTPS